MSGTKTGVFIGNWVSEYINAYESRPDIPEYMQNMAQIVSHKFNFIGPSMVTDSACASSLQALNEAVLALRSNRCDSAIVAGLNILLDPNRHYGFKLMSMLSKDGKCKCLDESANGYAKGEAVVAIVLQKRSVAKRIYAIITNIKSNNDGYEENGITYPTWSTQRDVMRETYTECGVDPNEVNYIEAHCTGTQAGDPVEMRAIADVFCSSN